LINEVLQVYLKMKYSHNGTLSGICSN
jgi:hypothetical protein